MALKTLKDSKTPQIHTEIIRLLITEAPALVNQKGKDDKSMLEYVQSLGLSDQDEILGYIQEPGLLKLQGEMEK